MPRGAGDAYLWLHSLSERSVPLHVTSSWDTRASARGARACEQRVRALSTARALALTHHPVAAEALLLFRDHREAVHTDEAELSTHDLRGAA